jgi:hypothetical protein
MNGEGCGRKRKVPQQHLGGLKSKRWKVRVVCGPVEIGTGAFCAAVR